MEKNTNRTLPGKPLLTGDEAHDIPRLFAEIIALRRELARTRQRAANLEAAISAALSARESGECDPFWYLRDEITYGHGDAYGA
ncbi:MAG: hypothetical protein J2P25_01400 [Nocardiopsaceae bacterium]|nr:hypothetical protein [Nocardiopsaceae bacterium]